MHAIRCKLSASLAGWVVLCPGLLASVSPAAYAAPPASAPSIETSVSKGFAYLRATQEKDGSWSHYPAITALALAAFLRNGKTEVTEPAVAKGVQFILRAAKPSGAIYTAGNPAMELPNYNTCLCLMALTATRNPNYRPIIRKAQAFLETSQFDDGENIKPSDATYGGIGYGADPDDHPDLGNLSTALQALHESGVPANAAVFKKAIVFIQRVQNRKETNDQAWAKTGSGDGGFVYDSTGESKITNATGGATHTSMGTMTYAGLESYIYAGVDKNDPRAKAAYNWIRGHYNVKEHPGMGDTSLYYYFHTMSKTLDVYGASVLKDTTGKAHNWAQDLSAEIIRRQHPDGSWYSTNSKYWENQPGLVTSYSLIALAYCRKK